MTLTAIDGRSQRQILTPFDNVEPLDADPRLRLVTMARWRQGLRALLAENAPAGSLSAASSARIDLLPHQLEPALALLRGLGSRVLLADEVGLGKTIQAGLALAELKDRGVVDRVLVLTPAGLRDQWSQELEERFALHPAIVDAAAVRRRASTLPVGLNPWSTLPLAIASIDYVKRPEVLPALLACQWDLVIVDEAHGVASVSDRHAAVNAICRRAPYVLLLTATPHNGDQRAFASLCGIGAHDNDSVLVFRRTRQEIAIAARRRICRLMVRPSREERQMHELLARFARDVRAERGAGNSDVALALAVLNKRAFSSPYSLEQSLIRRIAALELGSQPTGALQLSLPLDDGGGELDNADQPPLLEAPLLADVGREQCQLLLLADAARKAARKESKLAALGRLLRRLKRRGEHAIVFTEYRDTLLHVRSSLATDCAMVHGGLNRAERRLALDDFATGRRSVLLATDAAGEGLNLQDACRTVIMLELPWNPTRIEQRIGRVDRIGQTRPVHAVHFIARGTGEDRILERLDERVAQAAIDLDAASPPTPPLAAVENVEDVEPAERLATTVVLAAQAAVERERLMRVRADAARGQPPISFQFPMLARSRRGSIRYLLAGGALVLLRTDCEDGYGRRIATHVTPIIVNASLFAEALDRRTQSDRLASFLAGLPRHALDRALADWPRLADWKDETRRRCLAFWTQRLDRERAIARDRTSATGDEFQPGLFERRTVRTHDAASTERRALRAECLQRIAALETESRITIRPHRPALLLISRRRY